MKTLTKETIKGGDVVRLVNCTPEESKFRYIVANVNEVTERAYITLICDDFIKPSELVSLNDIKIA